jgi:hypothetical protein
LELPDTVEGSHFDHPDFRVRGKIFATLWPADRRCVVKLEPAQRRRLMTERAAVFEIPGRFSKGGWTLIDLRRIGVRELRDLMHTAWSNVAPAALVREHAASARPHNDG